MTWFMYLDMRQRISSLREGSRLFFEAWMVPLPLFVEAVEVSMSCFFCSSCRLFTVHENCLEVDCHPRALKP